MRGDRRPPGESGSAPAGARLPGQAAAAPKPLWFIDGTGKPDCVLVQPGISDGSFTEIRSRNEDLEGKRIIVRERPLP